MKIIINGNIETTEQGQSVSVYFLDRKMNLDQIVVAINDEVVEKDSYDATILNDGDVLDVMSFVGGG